VVSKPLLVVFMGHHRIFPTVSSAGGSILYRVLMQKKYIIVVSVVIALWVVFMVYRHVQGKRDTEEYRAKEYSRITHTAKKSPRAGLTQMGGALQRYHEEKHAYPSSLNDLYPKYVANKSFIDEIDWYYEPRVDNFSLSKAVIRENKRVIAFVDKGLKPRVETGVMVAAPTLSLQTGEAKEPRAPVVGVPEASMPSREEFWETLRQRQMDVTAVSTSRRGEARIATVRPEIVSVVEPEVISDAETATKPAPSQTVLEREYAPPKGKAHEAISSELSTRYLV